MYHVSGTVLLVVRRRVRYISVLKIDKHPPQQFQEGQKFQEGHADELNISNHIHTRALRSLQQLIYVLAAVMLLVHVMYAACDAAAPADTHASCPRHVLTSSSGSSAPWTPGWRS